ncbi:MAG: carbohydrate binding family 9 domain-containing protein [Haliscomenobacter sp.]|nr:carbohydrate binding family 9 domain-containing protein [Haliscomenobacter sp.]
MKKVWTVFVFAIRAIPLLAQETQNVFPPPPQPQVIMAKEAVTGIRLDGRLDDPDWRQASLINQFFRIEPRQGGSYGYPTEVRVLFDARHLYFGVFCRDSLGRKGVRVQDLRRDFSWGENDIFGIQLDPQNLKQYCVSFQTTPYGNQRDLQVFNDDNRDNDWNALWAVRTVQTDTGYFAEFAIPFKSLRYEISETDSVAWGLLLPVWPGGIMNKRFFLLFLNRFPLTA